MQAPIPPSPASRLFFASLAVNGHASLSHQEAELRNDTVGSGFAARYEELGAKIQELAQPGSEEQFWAKPFSFGNSFGHLVLHLTGNLNYYIGAQIANTGYVRDRPREFNDPNPPSKEEALKRFDEAVAMVVRTTQAQSPDDWSKPYTGVGATVQNRLDMVVQCAAHMQHHIGQMIYLVYSWQQSEKKAS